LAQKPLPTSQYFSVKLLFPCLLIIPLYLTLSLGARNAVTAATPAVVPTFPNTFAGEPEFNTTNGRGAAGTASVVKLKNRTQSYIVSVRHLLGPNGAFKRQVAAQDVPAFVRSIRITSFSGAVRNYHVVGLLVPTNRLKADGGEPLDDLAIYLIKDKSPQGQAVVLADKVPAVRTQVWVVSRARGDLPDGKIMQSGRVVRTNSQWLVFQFDDDRIVTGGRSGAPVLNAAGEVIGVYSGHRMEQGHVFGFAIPAPLIATTIKVASAHAPVRQ
jgi:S1-C subfamily serine protease